MESEQHHHVLPQLHQALGAFDGELGDDGMVGGRAVEGGRDDLTLHGALHVGDLFRAFIDEHDHEVHLGIVHSDRIGDVLQRDRLASFGGETIRPRWPLPIGETMSIRRR